MSTASFSCSTRRVGYRFHLSIAAYVVNRAVGVVSCLGVHVTVCDTVLRGASTIQAHRGCVQLCAWPPQRCVHNVSQQQHGTWLAASASHRHIAQADKLASGYPSGVHHHDPTSFICGRLVPRWSASLPASTSLGQVHMPLHARIGR